LGVDDHQRANRGWLSDVMTSDCSMAGLPVPSLVRTTKVATIERREAQKVGCLLNEDRAKVAAQLRQLLAPSLQ
jgi:mRNA interferase MazF